MDSYRREKAKPKEPSGSGHIHRKVWKFYDEMKFVENPASIRQMTGNLNLGDSSQGNFSSVTVPPLNQETGGDYDEQIEKDTTNFDIASSGRIGDNPYSDKVAELHGDSIDAHNEESDFLSPNKRPRYAPKYEAIKNIIEEVEERKKKTLFDLKNASSNEPEK